MDKSWTSHDTAQLCLSTFFERDPFRDANGRLSGHGKKKNGPGKNVGHGPIFLIFSHGPNFLGHGQKVYIL